MEARDRTGEFFEHVSDVLKAMADPMRLRLLHAMQDGERCVGELVSIAGTSQANVSKHLKVLRKAGLVSCRREGLNVYYDIGDRSVFHICSSVSDSIMRRLDEEREMISDSRRRMEAGAEGGGE